jgi:hypothetical protein
MTDYRSPHPELEHQAAVAAGLPVQFALRPPELVGTVPMSLGERLGALASWAGNALPWRGGVGPIRGRLDSGVPLRHLVENVEALVPSLLQRLDRARWHVDPVGERFRMPTPVSAVRRFERAGITGDVLPYAPVGTGKVRVRGDLAEEALPTLLHELLHLRHQMRPPAARARLERRALTRATPSEMERLTSYRPNQRPEDAAVEALAQRVLRRAGLNQP